MEVNFYLEIPLDTITFNDQTVEVDHLANFDYRQLFNWTTLKDTHFLLLFDVP